MHFRQKPSEREGHSRFPVLLVETEIQQARSPGGIPAGSWRSIPVQLAGAEAPSRAKSKSDVSGENWMSIELKMVGGTDMRIQGGLTLAMVYTILKSL